MKIVRLLLVTNLLVVVGHFRPVLGDEVRPTAFLHALQKDYGDMAVDYLNMLKRNDDLSKELRDTWDLEMSKSLRSAAGSAYNAEDSESLMREAEKHLTKFLQEKPDHAEASEARAIWADFSMDKALKDLRSARTGGDKKQKAQLFDDARSALREARVRFKQAEAKCQAELDAMQPPPKRPLKKADRDFLAQQQEIKANILNYRFQDALIDYYLAQTYDTDSPQRKQVLEAAAVAFGLLAP